MQIWLKDELAKLDANSEQEVFDQIVRIAKNIGFEYCSYGIRLPTPILKPKIVLFNNCPANRNMPCHESQLSNPNIQNCLESSLPVLWTEKFYADNSPFSERLRSYGIRYGWTHFSRDAQGTIGSLALASCNEEITERDMHLNQVEIGWLTHYGHAAMAKFLIPKYVPESVTTITAREREVLLWTAEGKTAYEIGKILDVTTRTVNFHVQNLLIKLRATNKIQATIKAEKFGLLL